MKGGHMAGGIHFTFGCDCGGNIAIHEGTLAQHYGFRGNPKNPHRLLAAVCTDCKHVRLYDPDQQTTRPPFGGAVMLYHDSAWGFVG